MVSPFSILFNFLSPSPFIFFLSYFRFLPSLFISSMHFLSAKNKLHRFHRFFPVTVLFSATRRKTCTSEISASRNTTEGPRNRTDIHQQCSQSPSPAGATISAATRRVTTTFALFPAMKRAACRIPMVRKGMKRRRILRGGQRWRIRRRDTNLYSCKIKSHRRSAWPSTGPKPTNQRLICIKNRLFHPISRSATLAATGQSGWLSFN